MNRPSKEDDGLPHPGWNQNPSALSGDLTTRQDLIGTVNARSYHDHSAKDDRDTDQRAMDEPTSSCFHPAALIRNITHRLHKSRSSHASPSTTSRSLPEHGQNALRVLVKYCKYVGPGAMVSVAYIDPGNYATDIAAGVSYRFKLLFIVLLSNLIAIFLQTLCIRLGCTTGKNLAQMCKLHFPRWLNFFIYVFAEGAIIATDIAEVIGTAIALNLLFHLPIIAGCAISILDVLVILLVYRPGGSMRTLRAFELFVLGLVLAVVVCFCFQLSLIQDTSVGDVFKGYLPSSAVIESKGLYQSIGILGATVMPHSLYLGTGVVQPRLYDLDRKARAEQAIASPSGTTLNTDITADDPEADFDTSHPTPLLSSIRSCIKYSTAELAISLFTFALFVNSSILIIAGAALHDTPGANDEDNASLFAIHDLLSRTLSKAAGVVFALALLLSGTSAGIVCTIAGQIVSEGHLRWNWDWTRKPWVRRLITRSIAIIPSIIIAGAVGAEGLSSALEASQVALSIILPVVSGPAIWFTCFGSYMVVKAPVPAQSERSTRSGLNEKGIVLADAASTVPDGSTVHHRSNRAMTDDKQDVVSSVDNRSIQTQDANMRNHWIVTGFALAIWILIVVMNVAALVFLGEGVE